MAILEPINFFRAVYIELRYRYVCSSWYQNKYFRIGYFLYKSGERYILLMHHMPSGFFSRTCRFAISVTSYDDAYNIIDSTMTDLFYRFAPVE